MMKPILFNTQMVRAILDGRKTMTRRLIKDAPTHDDARPYLQPYINKWAFIRNNSSVYYVRNPYKKGDILYVRETWSRYEDGEYAFRTDYGDTEDDSFPPSMLRWHPSIHMPKEAARIFLRVKDVRVERLQDISIFDCKREGAELPPKRGDEYDYEIDPELGYWFEFQVIWESTLKQEDKEKYGWNADPWVFVVFFERISKEEAEREPK